VQAGDEKAGYLVVRLEGEGVGVQWVVEEGRLEEEGVR
jgi:hypothetical protein